MKLKYDLAIILLVIFVVVLFSNKSYGEEYQEVYFRGKVIQVDNLGSGEDGMSLEQKSQVLITSGEYKGRKIEINSLYKENHPYMNLKVEEGMKVLLVTNEADDELGEVYLHDVIRDYGVYYLLVIFALLLLIIGRGQGLKTIITLVFTGIIIVKMMLPLLLQGKDPIFVAVMSAIVIIVPTLLIIGGFNSKSIASIIGTGFGVITSGILALWIGKISYLTGFSSEESKILIYMDNNINIRGLLFAGIIIGSLGAITDVCMSISSAIFEIKQLNKSLGYTEMFQAGLNVGRDIMGTMSNTLLLAYVGGSIPLLLVLLEAELPWIRIINMDVIVTEFVSGLAGSIGLIIAIPVTAFFAAVLMWLDN
ncbi:hypothetical protein U472_14035 [Orenia metallireducens]|uniref:YibE/F family protein n=1 Tax=Orenia metallireducens TaxID=1413210 RepID=A0A1C0A5N6_9FIRM|nr:YibE/F family protein [Orenia metallireducens]OCL25462.1 hypothetical protein U472_14035 [Orenia metallireducens]